MKETLLDYIRLLKVFYKLQLSQALKSPINFWTATLVQTAYYAAQIFFWVGIRSTNAGAQWMTESQLVSFLVTVCLVDNLYLFLFGRGSMILMQKVRTLTLDNLLLWPRSKLGTLLWISPNWTYLPCVVLSLIAFVWLHTNSTLALAATHLAACIIGLLIMNGISFLFRMTTFWSSGVTLIRHANPSYKIMVRPFDAFETKMRIFLLTLFPALFITGVPAQIADGRLDNRWLVAGLLASVALWAVVCMVWRLGVSRYSRVST